MRTDANATSRSPSPSPYLHVSVLALLSSFAGAWSATVTIDAATEYQTMEGFGTSGFDPQRYDTAFMRMMIDDLGMTAMRLYIDEDFEISNDNADPFSLNMAGCNLTGSDLVGHMRNLSYLRQAGLQTLLITVFSPPAWMKTNGNIVGGSLRTDMYDEFAEYYAAYIKLVKQQTGIDVFAVSPENEPAWEQWYWSCVYTYAQMRDVTKKLGERFASEQLPARIFAAEDLITNTWGPYYGTTIADPAAGQYLHALAVHAYENGISPASSSAAAWRRIASAAAANSKSAWMTETSGYSLYDNWLDQSGEFGQGAFTYACAIYSALAYGNVSLWLWLAPTNPPWGALQEGMCHERVRTRKYYASKNFYRYIRPGAVRVSTLSDDSTVLAVAFNHKQNHTLSIVLLNTSSTAKSVSLAGTGLPSFTAYRSTATDNCASTGTVTTSVSLPATSITTLFGQNYTTPVAVARAGHTSGARPLPGGRRWDLAGRSVAPHAVQQCAGAGICVVEGTHAGHTLRPLVMPLR